MPPRAMSSSRRDRAWAPLVLPGVALLCALYLLPLLATAALAFTDWQFARPQVHWTGLDNFVRLAHDPVFARSARNTALYVLMVVPCAMALGLAAALQIQRLPRGRGVYRVLIFIPVIANMAAMSIVWEALLHPTIGPVNQILEALGGNRHNWLHDPALVLPVLAAIDIWHSFGFAMLLFLAGLDRIPAELYQAASLDGVGGGASRMRYVTLPQLAPSFVVVTVVMTARALQVFDTVQVLTRGGPELSSETLLYTIYVNSFQFFDAGYGATMALVYLAAVGTITFAQNAMLKRQGGIS